MEQLANEIVELDAVRQDVLTTQAMIRRDIAGAVLQSALCLKEFQTEAEPAPDSELKSTSVVLVQAPVVPQSDEWATRLVRWADQFGRDLFKLPTLLLPSAKRNSVPASKLRDRKS
jgi:hypothetical protein